MPVGDKMDYKNMTNLEEVMEKLTGLKSELKKLYKVREMGLFGSWVYGEQNAKSDLDMVVEFEEGADLFDWIGLGLYLEDIFGCPVDIVLRNTLRQELKDTILEHMIKV